ncbi:MAG: T9SS type A sorting domain-containing protein [Candidatus Desantisbacteria bacterium]
MKKVMGSIRVYGFVMVLVIMGFAANGWAWGVGADIKVTPTTGTVGTLVTVQGASFGTSTQVKIDFGTTQSIAFATTDENGSFTTTFTATIQPQGSETVKVKVNDDIENEQYFYLPDTLIISPFYISLPSGLSTTYTATAMSTVSGGSWTVTSNTNFTADVGSMTVNTYTAGQIGNWTITGTYTTLMDTASVAVTHGTVASIKITPATASVASGETVTYIATAMDANSNTWVVTGSTTFGTSDPKGNITSGNIYTAGEIGIHVITGTYSGKVGTASVTVTTHGIAASIKITPATASVASGGTIPYTATAMDAANNIWVVTGSTTFGTSDPKGNITSGNIYTAGEIGIHVITGTYSGKVGTASVAVTHGTVALLELTPAFSTIWIFETATYTATAVDMKGNTWTVTGSSTYSTDDLLGTMTKNIYTAKEKGTWTITGTYLTISGTATASVKVRPDLTIIKVGDEEVRQGDSMKYCIWYGNAGCSEASDVTLKDILPPGVTYATSTLGSPTINGNTLTWDITPIPSASVDPDGAERYAEITVIVGINVVGSLTNVAEIATSLDTERNFEYNRSTFTTVAKARMIDLAVSKTSPIEVLQGATFTYKITCNNLGNILATDVTLTDYLPAGVSYISNTLGAPSLHNNSKTLVWSINSLSVQTPIEFDLIVKVDSTTLGNITNVVSIVGAKTEVNTANNQASCVTVVKPSKVDLVIEKQGPGVAKPGQVIKYLISYHNNSQLNATNVIITDTLPSGVGYATSTIGAGTGTTTRSWSIDILPAQTRGSFELTVNVGSSTTGMISNVVNILCSQPESNPADNQATWTTTVIAPVDLMITKKGPDEAKLNTNVSYTIQYQRLSGGDGTATITDTLPWETRFVSSSMGTPSIIGNRYSWQVSISNDVMQFATVTVFVPGTVTIGTSLTNYVAIIPQDDSNWNNNFATWTSTTDESITDLDLLKYGSWEIVPDGKIIYRFWLNNVGETDITSGTLTDTLPIGLTWVENSNTRTVGTPIQVERERQDVSVGTGIVTGIGWDLIWNIQRILPAGSCTLVEVLLDVCPQIINYRTTESGTISTGNNPYIVNKVHIETIPTDSNMENNGDDFITRIMTGKADVCVYKYGPYESCPGQVVTYNIYGGNYGYSDAGGVTLKDTLPIGFTMQSITEYPGTRKIGSPTITTIGDGVRRQQVLTWNNIGTLSASRDSSVALDVSPCWFYLFIKGTISDSILPAGHTSINLDNFVEITTTSPEEGQYPNSMNFKTIVIPKQVDLSIWKSGPAECAPGDEIAYSISYYNNGPDTAHAATLTDTLPLGVEYATDTSGLPLTVTTTSTGQKKLIWTVGMINAMSSVSWWDSYKSFILKVKVGTLTVNTQLTNKIEIWSRDTEKSSNNNTSNWTTTVKSPTVNLTIGKGGPKEVIRGINDIWYWVWFSNDGNTTAKEVKIIDTLPSGVSYKNCYGSYCNWRDGSYKQIGTPSVNGQIVTWNLGDLSPNSYGYISIVGTANFEGYKHSDKVYNSALITSLQPDSNPNNNWCSCSSNVVNPVTNLHVIKHGPKKTSPGKEIVYTIHYGNAGNTDARNIEIVDTLDDGETYMGSELDCKYPPQIIGHKVIWRIPKIRHGFNTNFDMRVLVSGNLPTNNKFITNKVEITILPTDHNPKNNDSQWKTRVIEEKADLTIAVKGEIARPGFKKNLFVTCTNDGTGKAENVVVTLKLPYTNHTTYDYSYPQGDYNSTSNSVTWQVGNMSPGDRRQFRAKIIVKTSTQNGIRLCSKATVTTTSAELDKANNEANEYEDVVASYDPNLKTAFPQDFVPATATTISYTIMFENMATATANATKIEVSDKLSDKLDLNTVEIGDVCIGGAISTVGEFNIQLRNKLWNKLSPLIPSQYTEEEVKEIISMSGLSVWYHPTEGTITWKLDFGDYEFGLPPNNPLDAGIGWVSFRVDTIGTLPSGTEITNGATIKFDFNAPMDTPMVKHIVDGIAPGLPQIILDPYQVSNTFTVSWSGTDSCGKIAIYEVYAGKDNGTPTLYGSFVDNSASYVGIVGSTYTFYCKAKDMAGNVSATSTEVSTHILSAVEGGTVTKVIINPVSANMEIGEIRTLTACGLNGNGEALTTGVSYSWSVPVGLEVIGSTTNSLVVVKAAVAGVHTVTVTASATGVSVTTTGIYTVSAGAIDQITIVGSPTNMEIDQQAMFVGHAYNRFGAEIAGQTFAWEVRDAAVGSITVIGSTSTSATVTAKASGSGWVIATAGGKQGNLQISVSEGSVATVTVDGPTTLQLGQSAVFTARAYNQSGHELLNKIATWEVAPAPSINFSPSSASSAMLTAQAPGIGTVTGNIDTVQRACAITIILGTVTKLAITPDSQTIPAGMASSAIIVQAQNSSGVTVATPATITVNVTADSSLSKFSQSSSGAQWTGTATFVIPTGADSTSFFHKYNGTSTPAITITVSASGSITAATQSITITALGTATAGNIVADDGKTIVALKAGDLAGASFIEINTSPTPPGVNAPNGSVTVAQTLRKIEITGAGLSPNATVTVTIPYSEGSLAGNSEDKLQLYRLGSGSTTWERITTISLNATNNTVAGVVGSFSYFALMMPTWQTTLNGVIAYPSPCVTSKHGYQITFANLSENATIKIYNIAGELVRTIEAKNPMEIWNLQNDSGEVIASGIYIYLATDPKSHKKVGKLAIVK